MENLEAGDPQQIAAAFVPGLPLRQAVDRYGPLPEPALRRLAGGVAEELAAIHAAVLVHGAVGPDSVSLSVDGPRLAPSGTAGIVETAGSPMADMFDLGATMLYAASGTEAIWEGAAEDLGIRIAELETVTSVLPPSLREVIGGCLYPDPSTRPTAEQLVDYLNRQGLPVSPGGWLPSALAADLAALAAEMPAKNEPSGMMPPDTHSGGVSRRNLILGLAGGAILTGGVATAAFSSSKSTSPAPHGQAGSRTSVPPPTASADVPPTPTVPPSSPDGPAPIALDAPDAVKAWTIVGHKAPTCLEASDKVVMVITEDATAFLDASTGTSALPALNTTNRLGSDDMTSPTTYAAGVFYYFCDAPGAYNMVAAVDGSTGKVKWATAMAEVDSGGGADAPSFIARLVAVNGNNVYVCGAVDTDSSAASSSGPSTGYIRAFDSATGKRLWQVEGTHINNVLVPPSGSYLLAASGAPGKSGQVQMIDTGKQGAPGWKTPVSKADFFFSFGWPMTCYAHGLFIFAGGEGDTLFAVDAATGAEKWHQQFDAKNGDQVQLGNPFASLDGATVYIPVGSDLAAFGSADGTLKWVATLTGASEIDTANEFKASLRTAGMSAQCSADTVVVTDMAKTLWAIDAATGKARWKYTDPGQPDWGFKWTVGGDHVFVASNLTLTAISIHGQK